MIADSFNEFEISLSHSLYLPDEYINPQSLFPMFRHSGLKETFSTNTLDAANDPQRIVHPRFLGYVVSPGDVYATTTGTLMMPFPLNRTIPVAEYEYYTWRDTSLLARGGAQSGV